MTIVVDVGCHPHGPEESVYKLCQRFDPDILFGFDPYPGLIEGIEWRGKSRIVRRRAAAATKGGYLRIVEDGICTTVVEDGPFVVDAIDLPGFLWALPRREATVVKLDCEGCEFDILNAIRKQNLDEWLALVLVEWHDGTDIDRRFYGGRLARRKKPELRCPVELWD